jgi:hypothetical protein
VKPGVPEGIMMVLISGLPLSRVPVRAVTVTTEVIEEPELVMNCLAPSTTHSSPSSTALVAVAPARRGQGHRHLIGEGQGCRRRLVVGMGRRLGDAEDVLVGDTELACRGHPVAHRVAAAVEVADPDRREVLDAAIDVALPDHRAQVGEVGGQHIGAVRQRAPGLEDLAVLARGRVVRGARLAGDVLGAEQPDPGHRGS